VLEVSPDTVLEWATKVGAVGFDQVKCSCAECIQAESVAFQHICQEVRLDLDKSCQTHCWCTLRGPSVACSSTGC